MAHLKDTTVKSGDKPKRKWTKKWEKKNEWRPRNEEEDEYVDGESWQERKERNIR